MTTWTTIFPDVDGSPIRGTTDEFTTTKNFFENLAEDAQTAVDSFDEIARNRQLTGKLEGEAARAFAQFIDDVDSRLQTLPRVSGQAADVFESHVTRLGELKDMAEDACNSALARARAAWNERNDCLADQASLQQSTGSLSQQIGQLERGNVDGANDSELQLVETQLAGLSGSLSSTNRRIEELDTTLGNLRLEWDDLRRLEDERDRTTRDDLGAIDLADLSDPGLWDKVVNFATELVMNLGMIALGPLGILLVLYDGDWAAMLWDLKEILDVVLLVAGVIALICPLTAPFVIAIFALSAIALAVTTILYVTQEPNPDTGETVGVLDVGLSALGLVLSAGTSMQALRSARGLSSTFTAEAGFTSLARNHGSMHTMATGTGDVMAAADDLNVERLVLSPGTRYVDGVTDIVARANGGPEAAFRLGWDTYGAVDTVTSIPGIPDDLAAAADLDVERSVDVFPQIAYRHRFGNQKWTISNVVFPKAEPLIIPAN